MSGVASGAVLIGVDGELLNVDNYSKLFAKVNEWTNVPAQTSSTVSAEAKEDADTAEDGGGEKKEENDQSSSSTASKEAASVSPPSVNKDDEGGRDGLQEEEDRASDKKVEQRDIQSNKGEDNASTTTGGLRLTFRLQATQSLEVQDVFPLGLDSLQIGKDEAQDEEQQAHVVLIDELKERVGDPNIPDRLCEHFLKMCDWLPAKAQEQVSIKPGCCVYGLLLALMIYLSVLA